jgi:hypothetical protein
MPISARLHHSTRASRHDGIKTRPHHSTPQEAHQMWCLNLPKTGQFRKGSGTTTTTTTTSTGTGHGTAPDWIELN